jgi:hypothetical protein
LNFKDGLLFCFRCFFGDFGGDRPTLEEDFDAFTPS